MPNLIISGKDFKLTPQIKEYVTKKMGKVSKLAYRPISEMKIELDVDHNQRTGNIYRAEASVILAGKIIKAGEKADNLRAAIDLTIPKIIRQVEKVKEKILTKRRARS
jgi:putative sigma-54 modulation protein